MTALHRARKDLDEGRPWMARDRLLGLAPMRTGDPEALELLARSFEALNDLPAAGLAWFLGDRPDGDPETEHALALMRRRYPNPVALAHALAVRRPPSTFSEPAQRRIRDLQSEIRLAGGTWQPPGAPQGPARRSRGPGSAGERPGKQEVVAAAQATGLWWGLCLAVLVFVVGLVESVRFVVATVASWL